jgi:hypothetical protein
MSFTGQIIHDRPPSGMPANHVHEHGACLTAQLVHDGANSRLDIAVGRIEPDRAGAPLDTDHGPIGWTRSIRLAQATTLRGPSSMHPGRADPRPQPGP